jgi:hypothetical protein
MSFIQRFAIAVTTAADGSFTGYSDRITGRVLSVRYVKPVSGGFDDGSTITITAEATGETIWGEANVNASTTRAPRAATHSTAGAASLYAAAGQAVTDKIALANDRVKVVIASGGNVKAGTFYVTVE